MKKSEFKKFIREEIITTLSEDSTAMVTSKAGTKSVAYKNPAELSALKSDPNVTGITNTAGQKIKEGEKFKKSSSGFYLVQKMEVSDRFPEKRGEPFITKNPDQYVNYVYPENNGFTISYEVKPIELKDSLNENIKEGEGNNAEKILGLIYDIVEKQNFEPDSDLSQIFDLVKGYFDKKDLNENHDNFPILKNIEKLGIIKINLEKLGVEPSLIKKLDSLINDFKSKSFEKPDINPSGMEDVEDYSNPFGYPQSRLSEMARTPTALKAGDPDKIKQAKSLYDGTWLGTMIDKVIEAGETGISQVELATALGKGSQQTINPKVNDFLRMGVFSVDKKEPKPEKEKVDVLKNRPTRVEKPSVAEPEDNEPDAEEKEDTFYKVDPEDTAKEEEPKASDIKAAEKSLGGKNYAKTLSPDDEAKYQKLKTGITAKVSKISKLPKAKRQASDDMKILRQLIKRDDVKKLFKAKGVSLKDVVADVIS